MKKGLILITILLILSACGTLDKNKTTSAESQQAPTAEKEISNKPGQIESENIDQAAIQKELGLMLPMRQSGFFEKKFNSCEIGYGYSKTNNCRNLYFTLIQFQLLCRDSEGTVSEVIPSEDLIKNSNRSFKWDLKSSKGSSETDGLGYAHIATIAPNSLKQQRLKITVENDFLYLKAGEVNKIVTPRPWCR